MLPFFFTNLPLINEVVEQTGPSSDIASSDKLDTSSNSDNNPYSLMNYLSTLTSTVGMENKLNREFNSAEAQLARDFAADQARLTRDFNSREAEKNRKWQELMSNSAYQRAVLDMKKAGINPILMASSGFSASSPTGSSASSTSISGVNASYNYGGGDTLSSLINALGNSARGLADLISSFLLF